MADGSSSNFRSKLRGEKPIAKSRFWGLELIDADLPKYGLAYGVIGSGPPILIYQLGAHETRILIDIPNSIHESLSEKGDIRSYIRDTVTPTLPKAIQPKVGLALSQGRLRSMPNQWLPPKSGAVTGGLLLGDANNMRHPLTGGGMTVALNDVLLLSELLHRDKVDLRDSASIYTKLQTFQRKRKSYSASINILAQALYTLFVADGKYTA